MQVAKGKLKTNIRIWLTNPYPAGNLARGQKKWTQTFKSETIEIDCFFDMTSRPTMPPPGMFRKAFKVSPLACPCAVDTPLSLLGHRAFFLNALGLSVLRHLRDIEVKSNSKLGQDAALGQQRFTSVGPMHHFIPACWKVAVRLKARKGGPDCCILLQVRGLVVDRGTFEWNNPSNIGTRTSTVCPLRTITSQILLSDKGMPRASFECSVL